MRPRVVVSTVLIDNAALRALLGDKGLGDKGLGDKGLGDDGELMLGAFSLDGRGHRVIGRTTPQARR